MKRIFALVLSAVLCLTLLTACGSGKSAEASGSTEPAETANAA